MKYHKRRWNRKEGMRNKDFKKGVSWVKVWVPYKGADWNPLINYGTINMYHSFRSLYITGGV